MMEIDEKILKDAENEIRDIVNWVVVFETEYSLPKEIVDELRKKLEAVAQKLVIS